jgi:hypothetical protein
MPSTAAEFDRRQASQIMAICCIQVPASETSCPAK